MLEVGGARPLVKKKESGGSMKDAIKRRFTVHKPQFTSDVVDAFEKIKSFSRGGYLLKIERVPESKEAGNDHSSLESVVVKWRAPIDHPTSDWIGIWPVGSRSVRKRVLQASDETPTRTHTSRPVAGKCWAFVPKGRKGLVTFSGDKLPTCEGRYRISYVLDGDPWSEQTIALHGPEFNIVDDKCVLSPRQELKHSGGSPLSPRAGGMTFSLSCEVPHVIDEEEKQRAWREDWMTSVEEVDQARLLEWEAKRLPCQKAGQTLAEVTFKVPQMIRSLRSRHDSASSSDSEGEDEREDEEGSGSRRTRRKERERMQKMKSEEGRGAIEGWRKSSRGGKKGFRRSASDNEPEAESPQLQSSASFSPVIAVIDSDGTDVLVDVSKAPKEKLEPRRRGGSLRRKKSEATSNLIQSSPSSIPVLHLKPMPFVEASPVMTEPLTLPSSPADSFSSMSSSSSSSVRPVAAFPEESSTPADRGEKKSKMSSKSSRKKKKGSTIRSSKDKTVKATDDTLAATIPTTAAAAAATSTSSPTSSSDVVARPATPEPSLLEADGGRTSRKSSVGSERGGGHVLTERTRARGEAAEELQSKTKQARGAAELRARGGDGDLFGVKERYQIELGRVTFSEEFIFYFLIFALVVFLIFYNALHELRLVLASAK